MALPAIVARLVIAALKRYAPKYVGAALKFLGVIELGELAHSAWREIFGSDERHAEAVAGFESGEAPADLVAWLRSQIEREPSEPSETGDDPIVEEEIMRQLVAAEQISAGPPALRVEVIQRAPRARKRKRSCN